jgi:hypothetical protein
MTDRGQLSEDSIEQEIQNKGLTRGYRLTPARIDAIVASAQDFYWHVPSTTTVVCALKLANGYVVTGEAACVEPSNFDEAIGRKIARDKAREKIWALEGYTLCNVRSTMG